MEFVKKNIIAVLCVLSILTLVFTWGEFTTTANVEMAGVEASSSASQSFGGFAAAMNTIFGYFLIIGPVALIAMNYVKQLEEKKGLLAIAVPVLCIVAWILVVINADSIAAAGSAAAAGASVETEVSLSLWAYAALVSYIATGIAGALTFHGAKVKALKEKGESFVKKTR
ncbi:MAG: hypothetical protein IJO09_07170 [Oscillospiraceae bacterium]|nr:hypothetical protein [Oscillospiraceae bacterium]